MFTPCQQCGSSREGLAKSTGFDYIASSRRLGSRWRVRSLEESPGSTETWRWITSTRREPRESATESKPPRTCSRVRVKGWGKSPPGLRRRGPHGKPRQEQDRIGGVYGPSSAYAPGVSHQACSNARRRGMTAEPARGNRTRLTGRLDSSPADAAERIDFVV